MLNFSYDASSQQQLIRGKIISRGTDHVLLGINVHNNSQDYYKTSDSGGNFVIPGKAGDRLIISGIGYYNDTIIVTAFLVDSGCTVSLRERIKVLPTLLVTGNRNKYQLDSLKRQEDYRNIYKRTPTKFAGSHSPENGAGISLSPITYFSKKAKQTRNFKSRQKTNELEYYIDFRFSKEYVSGLTRLQGDSLQIFMHKYRPSYLFCRKASAEDMLLYINKCLKIFLNR
jgi:hypothetical protein